MSAIVAVLPLFIFGDIMRFEFTSYEKIVETMMESFLAYLAVALFSLRKEHIIYTVALNTLLTMLHALLIALTIRMTQCRNGPTEKPCDTRITYP